MDSNSETRLAQINPAIAMMVRILAANLADASVADEIRVVQGLRSWDQQAALYAEGRTAPGVPCVHDGVARPVGTCPVHHLGEIVTRSEPGNSWHNFGLAVDVAPFTNDGVHAFKVPDWNADHPNWKQMEAAARLAGFVCGADFRTFPDNPHLQLTGRFPVNPDDEVRQIFKDAGMQAVWEESGIS